MPNSDSGEGRLTDLFHASQKKFGELLREVCEVSGFTQGKLSREAKKELQRLIDEGYILPEDPIGSMEQPTISKVMAGLQGPTYFQVFIWLKVIETYYHSEQFAKICRQLDLSTPPVFTPQLKQRLWGLASFMPPEELSENYEQAKDIKLIEIHPPLIEHKETRWNRTNKRPVERKTASNTLEGTRAPHKAAAMRRN